MGTTWVSFWTNLGDDFAILDNHKINGAKPLMADTAYSFFRADTSESEDDSTTSSITTKDEETDVLIPRGTLQHDLSSTYPNLSMNL